MRGVVAGVLLLGGVLGVQTIAGPAQSAHAADLSQFQPGNIIADALFFNPNDMGGAQIQAFLNAKVPNCASGYTCLKNFRQTTTTIPGTPMCSTYNGAANETAATIIWKVAQSCGISPKVILVVLQKEQTLVTSTAPSAAKFAAAMGAGCPDTAPCDANYKSFFQQVQYGTYLLKRYTQPAGTGAGTDYYTRFDLRMPVGQVSAIKYNPNAGCGTRDVYVSNQATHSLYIYTPYTPNQAALNAGSGTGDGCSSYGNRNFFTFYTDWFGSTQVPQLSTTGAAVLGVPQVGQTLNGYPGAVTPSPDSVSCIWLRGGAVISNPNGCLYQVQPGDVGQAFSVTVTSIRSGYQVLTQTSAPLAAITTGTTPTAGINPVVPARIADTRPGTANPTIDGRIQGVGALTPGQTLQVPVLGRVGIPTTGVGAVVLNITATGPTASSYLTVFPTGQTRPLTSSINFAANQTIANTVIAHIGTDGSISIYNPDGNTNVLVDITGWLPTADLGAVAPARIADTRTGAGHATIDGVVQGIGALTPGQTLKVPVLGRAGIPTVGVGAVMLNITAVTPTSTSYLTVFPTGQSRPLTSSLNFARQTIANTVVSQVGSDGSISIYNPDGNTDVLVDVTGWLPTAGINPVVPARIADTRPGTANPTIDGRIQGVGALASGQTLQVPVLGRVGIPTTGVGAVVLNITATGPTASSYLTVFPTGQTRPLTSSINFAANQTIANTVIAHIGTDGSISIYNPDGNTNVLVDITGWLPGS